VRTRTESGEVLAFSGVQSFTQLVEKRAVFHVAHLQSPRGVRTNPDTGEPRGAHVVVDWRGVSGMSEKSRAGGEPILPDRKISETFLDFAAPLLQEMPAGALEEAFERALKVAYAVWNAVVYADVAGDPRFLRDLRREVEQKPELARLAENLIHRKRSLFGDDWRCIGTWEVRKTGDGFVVRADARDPRTTSRRRR
jgi:hypothetical protein